MWSLCHRLMNSTRVSNLQIDILYFHVLGPCLVKLSSWKPPQCNIDDIIKKVKQALYLPNLNVSEESDWSTLCMAYVNSITNDVTIKSRYVGVV